MVEIVCDVHCTWSSGVFYTISGFAVGCTLYLEYGIQFTWWCGVSFTWNCGMVYILVIIINILVIYLRCCVTAPGVVVLCTLFLELLCGVDCKWNCFLVYTVPVMCCTLYL